MTTDLLIPSNPTSIEVPDDAKVIATLRATEPAGAPAFGFGLRIRDADGEREVLVTSDAVSVGSSQDDTVTVRAKGVVPGQLRLWRHAVMLVGARFQPGAPVEVEPLGQPRRALVEQPAPLAAGTVLRFGEAEVRVILDAAPPPRGGDFQGLVGRSLPMGILYLQTAQFASQDMPVLIQGPSGTGKEAVARALHTLSPRAVKRFVPVNCGGFTEEHISDLLFGHEKGSFTGALGAKPGLFEEADGGMLFLDEVGNLPLNLQGVLLRALQEGEVWRLGATAPRKVKVRVVAATNLDLVEAVRAGTFREDLYFRLNGITLRTPRLGDRIEDLPRLVEHFLATYGPEGERPELEPEAWAALMTYAFPGNVRELEGMLRVGIARLMADRCIRLCDLPFSALGQVAERAEELAAAGELEPDEEVGAEALLDVRGLTEMQVITEVRRRALRRNGGNKTAAARELGITRRTMTDFEG